MFCHLVAFPAHACDRSAPRGSLSTGSNLSIRKNCPEARQATDFSDGLFARCNSAKPPRTPDPPLPERGRLLGMSAISRNLEWATRHETLLFLFGGGSTIRVSQPPAPLAIASDAQTIRRTVKDSDLIRPLRQDDPHLSGPSRELGDHPPPSVRDHEAPALEGWTARSDALSRHYRTYNLEISEFWCFLFSMKSTPLKRSVSSQSSSYLQQLRSRQKVVARCRSQIAQNNHESSLSSHSLCCYGDITGLVAVALAGWTSGNACRVAAI